MRKHLFLAVTAVAAMAAAGIGTTMALFTDSRSSATDFTAGRLCLTAERNDGDPVPGPMFYVTPAQGATPGGLPGTYPTGVWAPGDTHQRTLTLYNPTSCSSMDAWVDSVQASLSAGSDVLMADKLWVEVFTPKQGTEVKVAEGRLSDFLAGPVTARYPGGDRIPLYLSSNRHLTFKVNFDIHADNKYQAKSLVVAFTVNGTQMKNNP